MLKKQLQQISALMKKLGRFLARFVKVNLLKVVKFLAKIKFTPKLWLLSRVEKLSKAPRRLIAFFAAKKSTPLFCLTVVYQGKIYRLFLNSWQLVIFKSLQLSCNLINQLVKKLMVGVNQLAKFVQGVVNKSFKKYLPKHKAQSGLNTFSFFVKSTRPQTANLISAFKKAAISLKPAKLKRAGKQLAETIYTQLSNLFNLPLHLIFPKGQTSRIASRYASTSTLFLGFVFGIYFTLSEVLIPRIRALTESTHVLPTNTAFNKLATSTLTGFDDNSGLILATNSEVKMDAATDWWDANYAYQKNLTIKNLSGATATNSASITVDTATLVSGSKLQADCDDLRVVYSADGVTHQEIARSFFVQAGATNCSDSRSTTVSFPLQAEIVNAVTDVHYYLYYGNSSASALSMPQEKYLTFDGLNDRVHVPA